MIGVASLLLAPAQPQTRQSAGQEKDISGCQVADTQRAGRCSFRTATLPVMSGQECAAGSRLHFVGFNRDRRSVETPVVKVHAAIQRFLP